MAGRKGFDEVMIVNPGEPGSDPRQGARLMTFGYGEPPLMGYYGDYGMHPDLGEYAMHPDLGDYGMHPDLGYYGMHPDLGYYGDRPELVGWGEHDPHMGYGIVEPVGYYAGEGSYGDYGDYADYGDYGEYGDYAEYAEPGHDVAGYVRDVPPGFNAGCPMPTNVSGLGEVEGYVKPGPVSPACEQFVPQPGPTPSVPETFRPLW